MKSFLIITALFGPKAYSFKQGYRIPHPNPRSPLIEKDTLPISKFDLPLPQDLANACEDVNPSPPKTILKLDSSLFDEHFFDPPFVFPDGVFLRDHVEAHKAKQTKKWGVGYSPDDYWFDPRIHSFGNTGPLGKFHSLVAPIATKLIDKLAYDGHNVRKEVGAMLAKLASLEPNQTEPPKILDLACGVGFSTRALSQTLPDDALIVGLDTSPEMLGMAKWINQLVGFFKHKLSHYVRGNAERTRFKNNTFNMVTCMYAFHEVPKIGRLRILREARRILKPGGFLALIDIAPGYQPSKTMLSGEPYVLEFQKNIQKQLSHVWGLEQRIYEVSDRSERTFWKTRIRATTKLKLFSNLWLSRLPLLLH